jgi:uncharacterized protein
MPTIPARSFATQRLQAGQSIKITNTSGGQVIDTWAFSVPETPTSTFPRYMSMIHTRSTLRKLLPAPGEAFVDNKRDPILSLVEDASPGVHDTLFAACSPERYVQLGGTAEHDSCAVNLYEAVKTRDEPCFEAVRGFLGCGWVPDPLNLFMNVGVGGGRVQTVEPVTRPGDYVVLRAERECVVFMSACPMDIAACNGGEPTSAEFAVL